MSNRQQNIASNVNPTAYVEPKSVGVAFALWFFLGMLGIHRFYLNRPHAKTILILTIAGAVLTVVVVGFAILVAVAVWVLVDAFSLSKWVSEHNAGLVSSGASE